MQAQLNAYGPRTTFIGRHPYADVVSPTSLARHVLMKLVEENPGCTTAQLTEIIGHKSKKHVATALETRLKYNDVHIIKRKVAHKNGNGATQVIHWYPGPKP